MEQCTVGTGIRIPLKVGRRMFTPIVRSSYKVYRLYKKPTAIERVNSRLDTAFLLEHQNRQLNPTFC